MGRTNDTMHRGHKKISRVFYAAAGPANLIGAHQARVAGIQDPSEVAITFSSQIEEFCEDLDATALFVSVHPNRETLSDGKIRFEHRPKRRTKGAGYYFEEMRYCFELLRLARRFKADIAVLDSGVTFFFLMALFRLAGISVVPVLHNTLWARGFRPTKLLSRLIGRLDALFFRRVPLAVLAVSPEAERQIDELAPGHRCRVLQIRAQFRREYFASIPAAPAASQRPFRVMFIGRVDRIKGRT